MRLYESTGMMTNWWTPDRIRSIGVAPAEVKHQVIPDGTKARVMQIKATDGDQLTFFDTGSYNYDAAGNITAIAGSAGVTAGWSYTYDDFGNLTAIDEHQMDDAEASSASSDQPSDWAQRIIPISCLVAKSGWKGITRTPMPRWPTMLQWY
jgi:hypothetical protein